MNESTEGMGLPLVSDPRVWVLDLDSCRPFSKLRMREVHRRGWRNFSDEHGVEHDPRDQIKAERGKLRLRRVDSWVEPRLWGPSQKL